MSSPIERWLGTFMCQKYASVFEAHGFKTLQSVCQIGIENLQSMGILPTDIDTIMENVTIMRQSIPNLSPASPNIPTEGPTPASSMLMNMSRDAFRFPGYGMDIPDPQTCGYPEYGGSPMGNPRGMAGYQGNPGMYPTSPGWRHSYPTGASPGAMLPRFERSMMPNVGPRFEHPNHPNMAAYHFMRAGAGSYGMRPGFDPQQMPPGDGGGMRMPYMDGYPGRDMYPGMLQTSYYNSPPNGGMLGVRGPQQVADSILNIASSQQQVFNTPSPSYPRYSTYDPSYMSSPPGDGYSQGAATPQISSPYGYPARHPKMGMAQMEEDYYGQAPFSSYQGMSQTGVTSREEQIVYSSASGNIPTPCSSSMIQHSVQNMQSPLAHSVGSPHSIKSPQQQQQQAHMLAQSPQSSGLMSPSGPNNPQQHSRKKLTSPSPQRSMRGSQQFSNSPLGFQGVESPRNVLASPGPLTIREDVTSPASIRTHHSIGSARIDIQQSQSPAMYRVSEPQSVNSGIPGQNQFISPQRLCALSMGNSVSELGFPSPYNISQHNSYPYSCAQSGAQHSRHSFVNLQQNADAMSQMMSQQNCFSTSAEATSSCVTSEAMVSSTMSYPESISATSTYQSITSRDSVVDGSSQHTSQRLRSIPQPTFVNNRNTMNVVSGPLQSLHKLAMFNDSSVVDPKSVVRDAYFEPEDSKANKPDPVALAQQNCETPPMPTTSEMNNTQTESSKVKGDTPISFDAFNPNNDFAESNDFAEISFVLPDDQSATEFQKNIDMKDFETLVGEDYSEGPPEKKKRPSDVNESQASTKEGGTFPPGHSGNNSAGNPELLSPGSQVSISEASTPTDMLNSSGAVNQSHESSIISTDLKSPTGLSGSLKERRRVRNFITPKPPASAPVFAKSEPSPVSVALVFKTEEPPQIRQRSKPGPKKGSKRTGVKANEPKAPKSAKGKKSGALSRALSPFEQGGMWEQEQAALSYFNNPLDSSLSSSHYGSSFGSEFDENAQQYSSQTSIQMHNRSWSGTPSQEQEPKYTSLTNVDPKKIHTIKGLLECDMGLANTQSSFKLDSSVSKASSKQHDTQPVTATNASVVASQSFTTNAWEAQYTGMNLNTHHNTNIVPKNWYDGVRDVDCGRSNNANNHGALPLPPSGNGFSKAPVGPMVDSKQSMSADPYHSLYTQANSNAKPHPQSPAGIKTKQGDLKMSNQAPSSNGQPVGVKTEACWQGQGNMANSRLDGTGLENGGHGNWGKFKSESDVKSDIKPPHLEVFERNHSTDWHGNYPKLYDDKYGNPSLNTHSFESFPVPDRKLTCKEHVMNKNNAGIKSDKNVFEMFKDCSFGNTNMNNSSDDSEGVLEFVDWFNSDEENDDAENVESGGVDRSNRQNNNANESAQEVRSTGQESRRDENVELKQINGENVHTSAETFVKNDLVKSENERTSMEHDNEETIKTVDTLSNVDPHSLHNQEYRLCHLASNCRLASPLGPYEQVLCQKYSRARKRKMGKVVSDVIQRVNVADDFLSIRYTANRSPNKSPNAVSNTPNVSPSWANGTSDTSHEGSHRTQNTVPNLNEIENVRVGNFSSNNSTMHENPQFYLNQTNSQVDGPPIYEIRDACYSPRPNSRINLAARFQEAKRERDAWPEYRERLFSRHFLLRHLDIAENQSTRLVSEDAICDNNGNVVVPICTGIDCKKSDEKDTKDQTSNKVHIFNEEYVKKHIESSVGLSPYDSLYVDRHPLLLLSKLKRTLLQQELKRYSSLLDYGYNYSRALSKSKIEPYCNINIANRSFTKSLKGALGYPNASHWKELCRSHWYIPRQDVIAMPVIQDATTSPKFPDEPSCSPTPKESGECAGPKASGVCAGDICENGSTENTGAQPTMALDSPSQVKQSKRLNDLSEAVNSGIESSQSEAEMVESDHSYVKNGDLKKQQHCKENGVLPNGSVSESEDTNTEKKEEQEESCSVVSSSSKREQDEPTEKKNGWDAIEIFEVSSTDSRDSLQVVEVKLAEGARTRNTNQAATKSGQTVIKNENAEHGGVVVKTETETTPNKGKKRSSSGGRRRSSGKRKARKKQRYDSDSFSEDETKNTSLSQFHLKRTMDYLKNKNRAKKIKSEVKDYGKSTRGRKGKNTEQKRTFEEEKPTQGPIVKIKGPFDNPTSCKVLHDCDTDSMKKKVASIDKLIPPLTYDLDERFPFVCSLCGQPSNFAGLGDLLGPYNVNGTVRSGAAQTVKSEKVSPHAKNKDIKSPTISLYSSKKSVNENYSKRRKIPIDKPSTTSPNKTPRKASTPKSTQKTAPNITTTTGSGAKFSPASKAKAGKSKDTASVVSANKSCPVSKRRKNSAVNDDVGTGSTAPEVTSPVKFVDGQESWALVEHQRSPPRVEHSLVRSGEVPGEVWLHEDCLVWTGCVYLSGVTLVGLEEALNLAATSTCDVCKLRGATLGCFYKACGRKFHFLCASKEGCFLDISNFSVHCPKHKALRLASLATT